MAFTLVPLDSDKNYNDLNKWLRWAKSKIRIPAKI